MITADGSFTQFSRNDYQEAEESVIKELKATGKPFVIVLNTAVPDAPETKDLARELSEKYSKTVIPIDCLNLNVQSINKVMNGILMDFPISEICFNLPEWILSLDSEHWLRKEVFNAINDSFMDRTTLKSTYDASNRLNTYEFLSKAALNDVRMGTGELTIDIKPADGLFYRIVRRKQDLKLTGNSAYLQCLKNSRNKK